MTEHVGLKNLQGPGICLCSSKAYFIAIIRLFIKSFAEKFWTKSVMKISLFVLPILTQESIEKCTKA